MPPASSNQIPKDDNLNMYSKNSIVKIGNATYEIIREFVGTKTTTELVQERLMAEINQQEAFSKHTEAEQKSIDKNFENV